MSATPFCPMYWNFKACRFEKKALDILRDIVYNKDRKILLTKELQRWKKTENFTH